MHALPPRALAAAALTAALVVAAPLAASAHVRVEPGQAEAGAQATQLTFALPNESDSARTTKVEIALPQDTPFTFASLQPVPGWTGAITTGTLPKPVKVARGTISKAPVRVTWTAEPGAGLRRGEFQNFTIVAGAMPDTGRLLLPATQTYSDGRVVRWDDPTPASGEEPQHPAPTVYINDAAPGDVAGPEAGAVLPIALSGLALAVALIALVAALLHGRSRRPVR